MKIYKLLIISVFLSLLVGCFLLPEEKNVLAPPLIKPPEIEYETLEVARGEISRQIYLYGHLVPVVNKELFFRYQGGRITKVNVEINDVVEEGDVLAELNLGNLENQLAQRKISLEKATIQYERKKILNPNKIDMQLATLDVTMAQLQLAEIQTRIDSARLVSPISGVIVYVDVEEGDYVDAFEPVMRLVDPSSLIMESRGGDDANLFHTGMDVEIIIKNESCSGKVVMSPRDAFTDSPYASFGNDQDLILIEVGKIPEEAGMADIGRVILTLDKRENTVVVPKRVIHQYSGRNYVNILNRAGLKEERFVALGIQTAAEVEILRGLEEGDLVITN
jgi:multidrug efflux pump subunit AcrA (membrane-fusion protein)